MKKKKKKNWLVNTLLILLLLVGIALIFNNQIKYFLMGLNADKQTVQHVTSKQIEKNEKADGNFDFKSVEAVSTEAVIRAQLSGQKLPVIGGIAVPAVDVNLPIFRGISNINLLYGAGTMKEDERMGVGNYALASHRVDDQRLLFSPIQRCEVGMMIYLTNLKKIYVYKTYEVKRVTPEHVEVIDDVPGKKIVTLVTCNDPGAIKRVIVHGELTGTYDMKDAPKAAMKSFKLKLNQGYW